MIKLLSSSADQLSIYCDQLSIIDQGSEPAAIAKAKKYIHSHLDQALPLGDVARVAGLSESHFCRLFKESNNLTLADYINVVGSNGRSASYSIPKHAFPKSLIKSATSRYHSSTDRSCASPVPRRQVSAAISSIQAIPESKNKQRRTP